MHTLLSSHVFKLMARKMRLFVSWQMDTQAIALSQCPCILDLTMSICATTITELRSQVARIIPQIAHGSTFFTRFR